MRQKIIILLLCLSPTCVFAQYLEDNQTRLQRLFWGGDIGLMFGTYTYISLSPSIGYRLTNRLSMGVGGNYVFAKIQNSNQANMFGGNVFASFAVIKELSNVIPIYNGGGILLYAEYNLMNVRDYLPAQTDAEPNPWVSSPMAGIAYQQKIGRNSYVQLMCLFNFNETAYTPFPNPVIKVNAQFAFGSTNRAIKKAQSIDNQDVK